MRKIELLFPFLLLLSCIQSPAVIAPGETDSLLPLRAYGESRQVYVGTSLSYPAFSHPSDPYGDEYRALAAREFNMITPEACMKMANLWTGEGHYDFSRVDALAEFAVEKGMKMRGHTLLWYRSVPPWLLEGYADGTYTGGDVEHLVENYISAVIGHFCREYPGLVVAWDVVNEAVGPNDPRVPYASGPPFGLRSPDPQDGEDFDFWRLTLGDAYPAKAFRWARASLDREGDRGAKLFYNDYNNEFPNGKQREIARFLREDLLDNQVPVDGVGLQCHFSIDYLTMEFEGLDFSIDSISHVIDNYLSLGLEVQITEIDIRINDDGRGLSREKIDIQADLFADILKVSLVKAGVTAFVSWGFTDRVTWYDETYTFNEPGSPTDEWPLYFDETLRKKPAYFSLQNALRELSR